MTSIDTTPIRRRKAGVKGQRIGLRMCEFEDDVFIEH